MASFTGLWKRKNFNFNRDFFANDQEFLNVVESGQFRRRGIEVGDFIYAVSTSDKGELLLIGKMQVGKFVSLPKEVESILGLTYEEYSGEEANQHLEYVVAKLGTLLQFDDNVIPFGDAKSLRFITKQGLTSHKFDKGTQRLNKQTLRTMRRLTSGSAAKLDAFLKNKMSQIIWYE
jgi:hypothetical protein